MKKVLIVITSLMMLVICADAQHLKFEGLTIDGTITEFQNKLSSKGIHFNAAKSKEVPVGQRIFDGIFHGYKASFIVFYNRKTKLVYKVIVEIESKDKFVIENILKKSLSTIESKYLFDSDHDTEDDTRLHFRYIIFPSKSSNQYQGIIHVIPTYYFNVPAGAPALHKYQNLELASYAIQFIYEDSANTSLLTPSTTEPCADIYFSCGTPENYVKYLVMGFNFQVQGCHDESIHYYTNMMDYHKYDCIPDDHVDENKLEELIMGLQDDFIGNIYTEHDNIKKGTNVYSWYDRSIGKYNSIEFSDTENDINVRLTKSDVDLHIFILEKLKEVLTITKQTKNKDEIIGFWREDTGHTLPAYVLNHRDIPSEYGLSENELLWKKVKLSIKYECRNSLSKEIYLTVYAPDCSFPLLIFKDAKEIDAYTQALRVFYDILD